MPATAQTRVLVVDDDDRFALAVTEVLRLAGFAVVGRAANGAEAARLASELRPDVATMDLDMPIVDGVEATRQLVALGVAVVVLTASDYGHRIEAAIAAGAGASLAKSDVASSLPILLRSMLHSR